MISFLEKTAGKAFFWALFLLSLFAFTGCSESGSDSDSTLPLSSPKSVQATPKDKSLSLQWTKVASAQGVDATYKVYVNDTPDVASAEESAGNLSIAGHNVSAIVSEFNGNPLENDKKYYVWVRAFFGSLGEGDFTATFGIPVPAAETPPAVYSTAGDKILWLQWEESPHAFSYDVAYSTTNGIVPSGTVTTKTVSTPYTVLNDLTNSTQYYIWVRASNTAGISDWQKIDSAAPSTPSVATSAPQIPIILSVTPGNKRLEVTWMADPSATYYELQYSDGTTSDSVDVIPEVGLVSKKITGIANGVSYAVKVIAHNSYNDGATTSSLERIGTPVQDAASINFDNIESVLGDAAGEFIFAEILPKSPIFVNGRDSDRLTRFKETALGNLFTDGTAWYVRDRYPEENIDFVLLNGGFIDNALTTGPITVGTLLGITKQENLEDTVTILTLNGADLKDLFTFMANIVHTGRGSAGTGAWGIVSEEVRYTIKYPHFTPEEIAANVELSRDDSELYYHGVIDDGSLTINGLPILDEQLYRIATTSWLAEGQEGYLILKSKGFNVVDTGVFFWQGVAEYIHDQKNITPYLDGRISIYGGVPLAGPQAPYNDPSYVFP
ncbi:MAG: 5'-nucleotidase C-terminal domain-containing protein [Deferribacteraceae bacterium]|jgi:hypothetical protein|nr:5'-nucleotidase C-terminal domain-containing protein [Deferribacteraceae bacterium]